MSLFFFFFFLNFEIKQHSVNHDNRQNCSTDYTESYSLTSTRSMEEENKKKNNNKTRRIHEKTNCLHLEKKKKNSLYFQLLSEQMMADRFGLFIKTHEKKKKKKKIITFYMFFSKRHTLSRNSQRLSLI